MIDLDSPTTTSAAVDPFDPDRLPGIEVTPLGATLTGVLDPVATVGYLTRLRSVGATWRWLVGDLVLALADATDLASAWREIASLDLDDRSSLLRSIAVAKAVPLAERRVELSWSHHAEVAGIDDAEERAEWLGAAVVNGWTVRQLHDAMSAPSDEPDDDQGELLPHLRPAVVRAINDLWSSDPDAVVVLRSDGTWRRWAGVEDPS